MPCGDFATRSRSKFTVGPEQWRGDRTRRDRLSRPCRAGSRSEFDMVERCRSELAATSLRESVVLDLDERTVRRRVNRYVTRLAARPLARARDLRPGTSPPRRPAGTRCLAFRCGQLRDLRYRLLADPAAVLRHSVRGHCHGRCRDERRGSDRDQPALAAPPRPAVEPAADGLQLGRQVRGRSRSDRRGSSAELAAGSLARPRQRHDRGLSRRRRLADRTSACRARRAARTGSCPSAPRTA